MNRYLVDKNEELTTTVLGQIIMKFRSKDLPHLIKLKDYYDGKQAILKKFAYNSDGTIDTTKKYWKVVTNLCKYVTDCYSGYLTGKPITYMNPNTEDDQIIDILRYNDYTAQDEQLLTQGLIYGKAFELCYVDEQGQSRFKTLDSRDCIDVYSDDLNEDLEYVIRHWEFELDANSQPIYMVEVYGKNWTRRYKSQAGFSSFILIEEIPSFFGQCPVSVFKLNEDTQGIFDQVITLQDGYNEAVSGQIDDLDAFADAYLCISGMTVTDETAQRIREDKILVLDPDCSASYLTKSINDTQCQNILSNLKDNIFKVTNCVDFSDKEFMSQSGIAIQYKLTGMEHTASNIANNLVKTLRKRIELLAAILNVKGEETLWRDIKITVTRNLPLDLTSTTQVINSLRGIVSDRTLLTLLPFIEDVDEELDRIAEQKKTNLDLYSFSDEHEHEVEEDE